MSNFKILDFFLKISYCFARIEVIIIEENNKTNNKYKPTNDYMFSRVFGDVDCREILKSFLQSILTNIEIVKITDEERKTKVYYKHWFNKYLLINLKNGDSKYVYVGNYSNNQIKKIIKLMMKKVNKN